MRAASGPGTPRRSATATASGRRGPTSRRRSTPSSATASPLDLPEPVLAVLLPRPPGFPANVEMFGSRTSPAFDALGAAGTAADLAVHALLERERAARLVDFHRRDPRLPGLEEVLAALD